MLDTLIGLTVHVLLTLLTVKLYTDHAYRKLFSGQDKKMSWKDATEVISKLEQRIAQLQERDAVSQEKNWNLDDQNRVLRLHISELKRELAAKSTPEQPFTSE